MVVRELPETDKTVSRIASAIASVLDEQDFFWAQYACQRKME